MRRALAVLCVSAGVALAADAPGIAPFSAARAGGAFPAGWKVLRLPRVEPPQLALVEDAGTTVLRSQAQAAAGTLGFALHADAHATLRWRWKVDHALAGADMDAKSGDDFAARVYVFFDVPRDELPIATRAKLALARLLHGEELPSTAICYVWDNRHRVGHSAWSPYTDRVRIVVLESGGARAGQWVEESRDLAADFRAAFPGTSLAPLSGIAAGNDTDQTGETVTAWLGDFRLEGAR